jgi:hypothetical protein
LSSEILQRRDHRLRSASSSQSQVRFAHFSFGALGADRSWELSRPLNSMPGRQATRKREEFVETVVD